MIFDRDLKGVSLPAENELDVVILVTEGLERFEFCAGVFVVGCTSAGEMSAWLVDSVNWKRR